MHGFSSMFKAATLLFLGLQLGINKAQNDIEGGKSILFYLDVPRYAEENEEITVKLGLETQYNECSVVKAYLVTNVPMEGNFNFKQTRCLCNDNRINLYWDFPVNQTLNFAVVVEIVKDKNICPNDEAMVPIKGDLYYSYRSVYVY
ncbi:Prolactin-inducible protein-like protein [Microtus ochrogaster]|uniref:Prolactin-inducible protein homolog n=1 Tax=Microtus ochrogaster TaxID=79684 RepID=A0A8J6GCH0_MICOH|nr:Prolactin-inducible protein-like protein [Microtus ochrogaster]